MTAVVVAWWKSDLPGFIAWQHEQELRTLNGLPRPPLHPAWSGIIRRHGTDWTIIHWGAARAEGRRHFSRAESGHRRGAGTGLSQLIDRRSELRCRSGGRGVSGFQPDNRKGPRGAVAGGGGEYRGARTNPDKPRHGGERSARGAGQRRNGADLRAVAAFRRS